LRQCWQTPAPIGSGQGTTAGERNDITFDSTGRTGRTNIKLAAPGGTNCLTFTRTVVDIGGQVAKRIRAGADGEMADFAMHGKCAAAAGRCPGVAAQVPELPLDEPSPIWLQSRKPVIEFAR